MATPELDATSANVYLNALQWGGWNWGAGANITYYFDTGGEDLDDVFGAGTGTSVSWLGYEQNAYIAALQQWANVANVTFTQVSSYDDADLVEHLYADSGSTLGIHETPQDAYLSDGTAWGAYSYTGSGFDSSGLQFGGYGFITFVHELGHGLGLAHPHDDGGGSGLFPGVTYGDSSDRGDNNLNQGIFTIMSYNDGWATGPSGLSPSNNYGWQATPMAFDVAAIQFLYGANLSYHAGADTYVLPDVNGPGTAWVCIWDAGGSDFIVYGGSRDTVIDLTPATLNNSSTGGGVPSYASGIVGGFTIANGVLIENVSGGSGNDTITGNGTFNNLYGNGGNDTIYGLGAEDILAGDAGNDTLYGGAGGDVISELAAGAFSGNDTIYGGDNVDIIYAGPGDDFVDGGFDFANNYINLGDGTDTAEGAFGNDVVLGGIGNDTLNGYSGDDAMYGEEGNDTLNGGSGIDLLSGSTGNDILDGGAENDLLVGDAGGDTLYGGSGIDVLFGFADGDLLDGGPGVDALYGGPGADDFQVGKTGYGSDYVWDFQSVPTFALGDLLIFSTTQFANQGEILAASSFASGNTTVMKGGVSTILVGVNIATLTYGDDYIVGGF